MFSILKTTHHYLAMFVLTFLLLIVVVTFIYYIQEKSISKQFKKISLITLIFTHLQLLVGLLVYASSPLFLQVPIKLLMKDPNLRKNYVEHPITMIVVIVLITIVNSKIKKISKINFGILFMCLIALFLAIAMIPRVFWLSLSIF